jgi:hypothetical protein
MTSGFETPSYTRRKKGVELSLSFREKSRNYRREEEEENMGKGKYVH